MTNTTRFLFALTLLAAFLPCSAEKSLLDAEQSETRNRTYGQNEDFTILPDRVLQGEDKICVAGRDGRLENNYETEPRAWKPDRERDAEIPVRFTAPQTPLLQNLFRLAQEETLLDRRPDGAFVAGAKWSGVWTRDVSYSIDLSLGLLFPESSMASLLAKTDRTGQIVQDTGTGGSWPLSTDRTVWASAAWEIYLVTGDAAWLGKAYPLIAATSRKDRLTVYNPESGLYRGETSFTDWREQTYPKWMTPTDIYESEALSTNVVHYRSLRVLASMARALGLPQEEASAWDSQADALAEAVNARFADSGRPWPGAYRYSPETAGIVSDKSDTLALSLAALCGLFPEARAASVIAGLPVVHFGPPIIYPQMAHAGPYHNKAIWPFVTAYYGLAGQKTGNPAAFDFALRSNVRAAAFFLTNKENFVYDTGHWRGTAVNSDRQLWSAAGFQAQIVKGLFGVRYDETGLSFAPVVPGWVRGKLSLDGLKWRNATINVRVSGNGSSIASLKVNGKKEKTDWRLPATAGGKWTLDIVMQGGNADGSMNGAVNEQKDCLVGPRDVAWADISRTGNTVTITWPSSGEDVTYRVYRNGTVLAEGIREPEETEDDEEAAGPSFIDRGVSGTAIYHLQAAAPDGTLSNLSAPLIAAAPGATVTAEAETGTWARVPNPALYYGFQGESCVRMETNDSGELRVRVPSPGRYLVRWSYSNGNGPINTDNKAAIRSLYVNGKDSGTCVFAQTNGWARWSWSNALILDLAAGDTVFSLRSNPEDANMNLGVNEAALDFLQLIRL